MGIDMVGQQYSGVAPRSNEAARAPYYAPRLEIVVNVRPSATTSKAWALITHWRSAAREAAAHSKVDASGLITALSHIERLAARIGEEGLRRKAANLIERAAVVLLERGDRDAKLRALAGELDTPPRR